MAPVDLAHVETLGRALSCAADLARHYRAPVTFVGVAAAPPDDFADRFPGTGGAIYGWPTHGMMGSFRRHGSRARLPGLYLAGQDVVSCGVVGAMVGGLLAAIQLGGLKGWRLARDMFT